MKFPSAAVLLIGVLGLSGLARAEDLTVLEPVRLEKQVTAPVSYSSKEALSGRYDMEDGRQLQVDGHGLRLQVRLGDAESVAMTRSGDGNWHSADGKTSLRFHGEPWARPDIVVLTMPLKGQTVAYLGRR